ncbi:MAG TPA: siderophore-interacting protein [Microbacterium sp.]|nr:siderophore-interacting protein [Microbacterium sp.]
MLTYALERDARPAYRPFRAEVSGIRRLAPHFVLLTFTGPEFGWFGTDGLDQRVKLLLPLPHGISDIGADDEDCALTGDWYRRWRELPDGLRNPFRTYTVRDVRPELGELDVVFVDHGDGGPAAAWLCGCAIGDEVVVVGPDARSLQSAIGIDWHPGTAGEFLLAGDETAAPAICSILESLPAGTRARAFVEVPSGGDALPVALPDGAELTWLPRDGGAVGSALEPAVRGWVARHPERVLPALADVPMTLEDIDVDVQLLWDSPEVATRGFYAWLAGESALIKSLRRFLVSEIGVDRGSVAFMGYWRLGKSEAQ